MYFIDLPKQNVFRENIVFGCLPIGNPADLSLNMIAHMANADILIVESHEQFSRLLSEIRSSSLSNGNNIKTNADIYQYDLDSGADAMKRINRIVMDNHQNKKILIVSDEGSSIFLEPACTLKMDLIHMNIPYQVISGPNSMVSTVLSADRTINEFYFGCGISAIKRDRRPDIFEKIKALGVPAVFLLTGQDAKESMEDLESVFGNHYHVDFSINLSMTTEEHVRGSFADALNYINKNSERFSRDTETDKYSVIIFPPHYDGSHYITYGFEDQISVESGHAE
jgi:16S rRNA C1402 (ribose-2'-O) methylase RsmI